MTREDGQRPDDAPAAAEQSEATVVRPRSSDSTDGLDAPVRSASPSSGGADLPHLQVGEILSGRFVIVRFIARGGMGAVYEANDTMLRIRVALKVIRGRISTDAAAMERFRREVLLARRVAHPNVCHVYELYDGTTAAGVPIHFLTMELLEGETLAARIRRQGRLTPAEALPLVQQMCEGLAAAHAEGVVHRDFKSSNVLLVPHRDASSEAAAESTRVAITDFGIARALRPGSGEAREDPLTGGAGILGTPEYMAPEQVTGGTVTPATDLYGLGVVMYEMVTGTLPFGGDTPLAAAARRIHEPAPPPARTVPGLDARWNGAILRCLAREPEHRFRSARDVASALAGRRRGPRPALLGATAVVLLALGLAAAWYMRRQARIRWAVDEALPQVAELVELNRYPAAVALAEKVEQVVPRDPRLLKLWPEMSRLFTVETAPEGADVSVKEYAAPDAEWRRLGKTPLVNVRIPFGLNRWRIEKPGFETVEAVPRTILPGKETVVRIALDRVGSIPPEMVRVPGASVSIEIPGLDHLPEVQIGDYLIDRTEVTNKDFKRFVDAGGYRNRDLWRHPVSRDGKVLSFDEAMALFRDRTGRPGPATWDLGDYPEGRGDLPVTGVSWYEAAAYAAFVGKQLPNVYQWSYAAGAWATHQLVPLSNFKGSALAPVGSYRGIGPFGTYDMAGNAKEWCWNTSADRRYILGGAWNEPSYMFNDADAQDPLSRAANFGFRLVKPLDDRTAPAATASIPWWTRDYSKEKPARPDIVQAYKRGYAYDRAPLEARVEATDEQSDRWRREKISFAAAYGGERVVAYLFTPRQGTPPFQTVVFFPGSNAIHQRSSAELPGMRLVGPILRSGRAFLYPVYKSTFERGDGLSSDYPAPTAFYRDHVIQWSKDLGRSIDYVETRKDLDGQRIAYYGASWGAELGPIFLALDDRLKVGILVGGGLALQDCMPEADPFNFAQLVRQPVLMVNGRYDFFFPVDSTQVPLFKLLGSPSKDKRHLILEAGHVPPNEILTREVLDWLDRYLGQPR
ncbi:MAG TPA: bifunctional serine/threonine-protein kinase/formylglycine-generating enzyme family protein [Myxococcaceae bacterium]|nr:bifunctional serine/threonine-protein kinase/formylglycine-generating enzyme family protein [Myxococcaceae bacterium]